MLWYADILPVQDRGGRADTAADHSCGLGAGLEAGLVAEQGRVLIQNNGVCAGIASDHPSRLGAGFSTEPLVSLMDVLLLLPINL